MALDPIQELVKRIARLENEVRNAGARSDLRRASFTDAEGGTRTLPGMVNDVAIADSKSSEAITKAENSEAVAQEANDRATKVVANIEDPEYPPTGYRVGDQWLKLNPFNFSEIERWYIFDGQFWSPRKLMNINIDSIQANKITSGSIAATTEIRCGSAVLEGTGFYVEDTDGDQIIKLGTSGNDYLQVANSGGSVVASISDEGDASFKSVNTQGLSVDGLDIHKMLAGKTEGAINFGGWYANGGWTTGTIGVCDVSVQLRSMRFGLFALSPVWVQGTPGDVVEIQLRQSLGSWAHKNIPLTAPTPTVNDQLLYAAEATIGSTGFACVPGTLRPYQDGDPTKNPDFRKASRILLCVKRVSGSGSCRVVSDFGARAIGITYIDMGEFQYIPAAVANNGGVGSAVPTPVQTYTRDFNPSWTKSFYGGGTSRSTSSAYHGQYSSSSGNQHSYIGFEDLIGPLSSAVVKRIEVFIYAEHAYYSSGFDCTVWGHDQSGEVITPPTNLTALGTVHMPKPGGTWFDVDPSRFEDFRTGQIKGLAFKTSSTSRSAYGILSGHSAARKPIIRITYQE